MHRSRAGVKAVEGDEARAPGMDLEGGALGEALASGAEDPEDPAIRPREFVPAISLEVRDGHLLRRIGGYPHGKPRLGDPRQIDGIRDAVVVAVPDIGSERRSSGVGEDEARHDNEREDKVS